MSGYRLKILKFICLSGLVLWLAALCCVAGCSKGVFGKRLDHGKRWACYKAADEAVLRHDYEAGILLHQRFLEKEPDNGLALYHLGYAYGNTGDHLREVFYYERAIALGFKEDRIFFNLGMAYGELDQIERSIGAFKKASDLNPDNADNHFWLAIAYQRSFADKLAEKEFLKVLKIDLGHVDARLYLSMLYADKGDFQKAGEQLRKILEIDPTHRIAREFLESLEKE